MTPTDSTHSDIEGKMGMQDPKVDAVQDYIIDEAAERRLVRKLDLRLLPLLALAYMLCYIDRSNAGNARWPLSLRWGLAFR